MKRKIIDRSTVESLVYNQKFYDLFPSMRSYINRGKKGRSCCGGKAHSRVPAAEIRKIKIALMGLPSDQMEELKKLLGADLLVFHLPGNSGRKGLEK